MSRGFSLIEVMVVIGIAGLLAAIGFVVSIGAFQRYSFSSERDLVVSLLQTARSKAMANVNESKHGVELTASEYILFEDSNGNGSYDSGEGQEIPRKTSGTVALILFDQLSGDANGDTTLTITGQRASDSADIDVSTNGRISWSWN